MKARLFVPVLLAAFLAGPLTATAQNSKEKKINREMKKIEKHSKKLQELQGLDYQAIADEAIASVNTEDIEKIREEAMAQADEEREQANEAREQAREAMEQQREVMNEQREAFREAKKEMERSMVLRHSDLDRLSQMKRKQELEMEVFKDLNGKKYHYYYKTPKYSFKGTDPIVIDVPDVKVDIPEFKGGVYTVFSDNQNMLSINKDLTDETSSADFNYEVKEGSNGISVNVDGAIDAGKVKILIKRPDGEVYNEYTLSPLANVSWNQTIKFEGQEESEYLGKWVVTVSAEKAKGKYNVHISGR